MGWAGHVAHMEKKNTCTYRIMVGKLEGKRILCRPGYGWEDNI
jgi:hypothetical protein